VIPERGSGARTIREIDIRAWSSTHGFLIDLAVAASVATAPLVVTAADPGRAGLGVDLLDVVASAVAFVVILLRRRAPLHVFAVALAAGVVSQIPDPDYVVLQVAVCVVLYTVASTHSRAVAWAAWFVAAGSLFVTATIFASGPWYDAESVQLIAWTGIAAAVGDAVHSQRAYIAAMRERAERAEHALEEEARRQVVEERLRIARELHDVVAHHIAVINVQAGAAAHLVRDDPTAAEEALAHVRRGAHSVLDEFSGILSVMRQPDDPAASTDPLPTLDQLDRLIADFRSVGFDVEWHTAGARHDVSPAVGLTAYRIIQESLTNAHRHGPSPRACLRVDYTADSLSIEVLNTMAAEPPTGQRPGHGIIGMRERVVAAGGTIDVGPTRDGRFHVRATLPLTGDDR
jgi:signal transduction histidine kinase